MLREHSSSRKAFSAIFVYVTTAGTVYMEQKQTTWGRGRPLRVSCLPQTGWLGFHTGRVPARGRAADLGKAVAVTAHWSAVFLHLLD